MSIPPNRKPVSPLTHRARRLRRDSTIPERALWNLLRGSQVAGLKFRRQHPVEPFVTDFCCVESALIVEIDGRSHDGRAAEDRRREAYLVGEGFRVLRVGNDDVLHDPEAVIAYIQKNAGIAGGG